MTAHAAEAMEQPSRHPPVGAKVERSSGYRKRKLTTRTPDRVASCRFFSTRGDSWGVLITQRSEVQILPPQPIRSRGYVARRDPFLFMWSDSDAASQR